jgi:hypothetical protein
MEMHPVYLWLDPGLIWFYRITGYAYVDFFFGTFILALAAVIIGEFTISLAFLANRRAIDKTTGEVVRYNNLSVDAVIAKNKNAYTASNKLANDAFGRSFFMQIALSTAFLWPIPFALGWMQYRFFDVEFRLPGTEVSVGYIAVFILLYITAYLLFRRVKYRVPYFRKIREMLDAPKKSLAEMKSFADLHPTNENCEVRKVK